MRRRAVLLTLSAGLLGVAGCNQTADSAEIPEEKRPPADRKDQKSPTDRQPDDSVTPEPPGDNATPGTEEPGFPDRTEIVDLEATNRTYALVSARYRTDDGAVVTMGFSATAASAGPVRVEATLANESGAGNTFALDKMPPFGGFVSDSPQPIDGTQTDHPDRAALVFAPTENHDLVEEAAEIEHGEGGHWRLASESVPDPPESVHLDAGETRQGEYALVGPASGEGLGRPPGAYEFSRGEERAVRVTVWKTDAPGPKAESRFAGESVPPLPGEADTAWYHEADPSTPTFVHPGTERTDLPASVPFTFVNRSREATACGHWDLYKLTDGEWFFLGPYWQAADCPIVYPGRSKTWELRGAHGEMEEEDGRQYPFLGGGQYAAVAGYGHATAQSGALIEFDAPDVAVVPTDDATGERSNGTVTVTSDRWREAPDSESRSRRQLVLEPTESAEERLIPEQVMRSRFRGLRNTLAFVGRDVDRVVLRTDDWATDRVTGHDQGSRQFEFEGQAYLATKSSQ